MKRYSEKPNVAIMTNFQEFNPGYSLTGIVLDQARMLSKFGYNVFIFVSEKYKSPGIGIDPLTNIDVTILNRTKAMNLIDYQSKAELTAEHLEQIEDCSKIFFNQIVRNNINVVFTHDFIFTGWNLPYGEAIDKCDKMLFSIGKVVQWNHWVHSVPSGEKDWWDFDKKSLNHSIVFPNRTEIKRVADCFKTLVNRVKIIPHIKDIRIWYDFCNETNDIIDQYPNILHAEIIQVYPCSTDRLTAKQLEVVIKIFGCIKKSGRSVFLCIVNQWATGRKRSEDITNYIRIAENCGLKYGDDFIFTSELFDLQYKTGVPQYVIRELQLLSNLFIFPTREESFGLVGPEASFSGALVVSNKSLLMMKEVLGNSTVEFDFGSFQNEFGMETDINYLNAVAYSILARIQTNEAITTKTYCRRKYNMDNLFHRYYMPLILG